jgi:hypothetical protein
MVTTDHGPEVFGALNTIVSARVGKDLDLVSSLASGLLKIGPRFGGALGKYRSLSNDTFATCLQDHCLP